MEINDNFKESSSKTRSNLCKLRTTTNRFEYLRARINAGPGTASIVISIVSFPVEFRAKTPKDRDEINVEMQLTMRVQSHTMESRAVEHKGKCD